MGKSSLLQNNAVGTFTVELIRSSRNYPTLQSALEELNAHEVIYSARVNDELEPLIELTVQLIEALEKRHSQAFALLERLSYWRTFFESAQANTLAHELLSELL